MDYFYSILVTFLISVLIMVIAVYSSRHLFKDFNVLVASQPALILLSCFIYYILLAKTNINFKYAIPITIIIAVILNMFHVIILNKTGVSILLLLTVLSNMILNQAWLAFDNLTEGSGGIFLPIDKYNYLFEILALLIIGVFFLLYLFRFVNVDENSFFYALAKSLGTDGYSYGYTLTPLLWAFAFNGMLVSSFSIFYSHILGNLHPAILSFSWSMIIVLLIILSVEYSFIKILASIILYNVFVTIPSYFSDTTEVRHLGKFLEILFPIVLFYLVYKKAKIINNNILPIRQRKEDILKSYYDSDLLPFSLNNNGAEACHYIERKDLHIKFDEALQRKNKVNLLLIEGKRAFGKSSFYNWIINTFDLENQQTLTLAMKFATKKDGEKFSQKLFLNSIHKQFENTIKTQFIKIEARKIYHDLLEFRKWPYFIKIVLLFIKDHINYNINKFKSVFVELITKVKIFSQYFEEPEKNELTLLKRIHYFKRFPEVDLQNVIIVVDNFSYFNGESIEIIFDLFDTIKVNYSKIGQNMPRILFILLTADNMNKIANQSQLRIDPSTCRLSLSALTCHEVSNFIKNRNIRFKDIYYFDEPNYSSILYKISGGIPQFVQWLGYLSFESAKSEGVVCITYKHITNALNDLNSTTIDGNKLSDMLLIALVNNGFSLFDDNVRNNDMIDYEIMKKFYTQKPLDYNNISFVDDVIFDGLTRAEWIELLEIGDAELKKFDFLFDQMIYAGILFKTQPQKNTAYKYYFCSELVRLFFNYYRP